MSDAGTQDLPLAPAQDAAPVDGRAADVAAVPVDAGAIDAGGFAVDAPAVEVGAIDTGPASTDAGETPPDAPAADVVPAADVAPDVGAIDTGPSAWEAATLAHVRDVRDRGIAAGNRPGVFAKIGDSITESASYLSDVGFGWYDLGAYGSLTGTITAFQATALGDGFNSFNRGSVCATAGWTTDDALAGGADSPLARELRAIRPSWAIVMYGTNDLDRGGLAPYLANMNRIVDTLEASGTVPVISTIPDRYDTAGAAAAVPVFNEGLRAMVHTRHLPLVEYWGALQSVPRHGLSDDNIHPSVYHADGTTQPGDFTASGLQYGYNVRNLTSLQMLDRLRAIP